MTEHSMGFPKSVCVTVYSMIFPDTGTHTSNLPCSETKNTNCGSSPGVDGVCNVISVGVDWAVMVGGRRLVDVIAG